MHMVVLGCWHAHITEEYPLLHQTLVCDKQHHLAAVVPNGML